MQNCRQVTKEKEERSTSEAHMGTHMHLQHQTGLQRHSSHRARAAARFVIGQQGVGNAGLPSTVVRVRVEETAGAEAEARNRLDAQRGLIARLQGHAATHGRVARDGPAAAGHERRQQCQLVLCLDIHRDTHSSSSRKGLFMVSGGQHQRAERDSGFALGGG